MKMRNECFWWVLFFTKGGNATHNPHENDGEMHDHELLLEAR